MSSSPLSAADLFAPVPPLVAGRAAPECCACVTIPVRNEEATLAACLDAFAAQQDLLGKPLSPDRFEILLLLNNCTDDSAKVAERWASAHPHIALHILECALPQSEAHAGTARRLLMDTAFSRLAGSRAQPCAILATDADSLVAPDWIAQNLRALQQAGADAVGGFIALKPCDLEALPAQVRVCYERDRRYAALIAELEDWLDPQPGDPWPRHLDHFGSSLACTPAAYAAAGGMPAVSPLEDEAFVDRLRRAGLLLRHEPAVLVLTSARLHGRATVGLAGQLRQWNELPCEEAHRVPSAAFLAHRFRTLRELRRIFDTGEQRRPLAIPEEYQRWVRTAAETMKSLPEFLCAIDSDSLIEQSFTGEREQGIVQALDALETTIAELASQRVCDAQLVTR